MSSLKDSAAVAPTRVLVVDDDVLIRTQLLQLFGTQGFVVDEAESAAIAVTRLEAQPYSMAIVDLIMPDRDGISLTKEIRQRWPETDVIMLTGHASIRGAVEAVREGASDYITKPCESEEILLALQKVSERRRLLAEIADLRRQLAERNRFAEMIGRDAAMREVFSSIELLADSDATVVIHGESGTGKELVARALHTQGKRRAGHFVAINCAALPEHLLESELFGYARGAFTGADQDRVGKIELANKGTLFLDEVESIPLAMQAKLLRVLEERAIEPLGSNRRVSVDMRVLCATNQDLAECVALGRMRQDFYYRINVMPLDLPPLRARRSDIPLLVTEFLRTHALARQKGIDSVSDEALERLVAHRWPGNVRELLNVLERAVLRTKGTMIADVDVPVRAPGLDDDRLAPDDEGLRDHMRHAEHDYLTRLLQRFGGGVTAAARHAGVDQATLHRKLRAHGMDANTFRKGGQRGEGAAA